MATKWAYIARIISENFIHQYFVFMFMPSWLYGAIKPKYLFQNKILFSWLPFLMDISGKNLSWYYIFFFTYKRFIIFWVKVIYITYSFSLTKASLFVGWKLCILHILSHLQKPHYLKGESYLYYVVFFTYKSLIIFWVKVIYIAYSSSLTKASLFLWWKLCILCSLLHLQKPHYF